MNVNVHFPNQRIEILTKTVSYSINNNNNCYESIYKMKVYFVTISSGKWIYAKKINGGNEKRENTEDNLVEKPT